MPIRTSTPEFTYKLPGKKLQAKINNFLVNSGFIDRQGFVRDHNTTIEFEYESKGQAQVIVRNKGTLVGDYTATIRRIYKNATFIYVEKYSNEVVGFMKSWVENMAKMTAVEQDENLTVV